MAHETMNERCQAMMEWMDAAVDGSLDDANRATLDAHVAECDSCRDAFEDGWLVRSALVRAPRPECPEPVMARILEATVHAAPATAPSTGVLGFLERLVSVSGFKPIAVGAAAALFLLLVLETGDRLPVDLPEAAPTAGAITDAEIIRVAEQHGMDPQELEQAVADAMLALDIFAGAMNDTGRIVSREVRTRLGRPMLEGFRESIDRIPPPINTPEPRDGAGVVDPIDHAHRT